MALLQQSHAVGLQYMGSTHCETVDFIILIQLCHLLQHLAAAPKSSPCLKMKIVCDGQKAFYRVMTLCNLKDIFTRQSWLDVI